MFCACLHGRFSLHLCSSVCHAHMHSFMLCVKVSLDLTLIRRQLFKLLMSHNTFACLSISTHFPTIYIVILHVTSTRTPHCWEEAEPDLDLIV